MAEFSDLRFDARVLKSAQALAWIGYHVDLLMYNASISQDQQRDEGNITYHEYTFPERNKTQTRLDRWRRLGQAGRVIVRISGWLLTHKANVYHAHNLYFLWAAVVTSKLYGAVVVYDAHELHSEHYDRATFKGRLLNKLNECYERTLLPQCAVFIQASEERAEFIASKYGIPKPEVINNYVPLVTCPERTERIRRECGLPPAATIIFYSGGVYAGGGRRLDRVIAALPQLPDTHFVIVGFMNDDIKNRLVSEAESYGVAEQLHLLPPCLPHEVIDYAASADVGVIPLWGDSLNTKMSALNKISEYLMAGLPIACTAYPNLEQIVYHNPFGPVGETFDVLSSDSIAQAIRSILVRREAEHFCENALRLAQSKLNWEREEQKLLAIYKRIGMMA
jgi:glycosyltransferase involved in cell wall biosynthesis